MHQYLDLLADVLRNGLRQSNRTGIDCFTLPGAFMKFDMADGFPAVTTKKLAFNQVKGELIGFLRGYDNAAKFRELGCTIWDQNANENKDWLANPNRLGDDDLGRIYGVNWRNWRTSKQPIPKLRDGIERTYLSVGNGSGSDPYRLKKTWEGMMARCYDSRSPSYHLYGGRGVFVCDRWLEFQAFCEDAVNLSGWELKKSKPEPFQVQLDKDTKGDGWEYSPSSCCWVSAKENSEATRNTVYTVEKDGCEFTFTNITEFCNSQGLEAKNFSDLWTGNKNARTRGGFRLVDKITQKEEKQPRGIDQVAAALDAVRNNPTSRRIIVSAWNPAEFDYMALPPCHIMFQLLPHVETKTLHMMMYQRSCDMFLGVPFNIASYALLLHLFAAWTGYKAGTLSMAMADVHIYENHIEQVKEQLTRTEFALPTLKLNVPDRAVDLDLNTLLRHLQPNCIQLENYQCHPALKAPMAV